MIDQKQLDLIRIGRHKSRTDLFWLCHNVLNYTLIDKEVHGPVIDCLASFEDQQGADRVIDDQNGLFDYTPLKDDPVDLEHIWDRRVILDPRGWFKTTLNCISHSIQLILNFPNISIHLVHAQTDIAHSILGELKGHFIHNERMRALFPEFCTKRVKDTGTKSEFTSPARTMPSKEPTVSCSSIQSVTAGMHYHWMKFTDIVDHQNSQTPDQLSKVIRTYNMYQNLLITPAHFIDIEGTCYNYDDVYNRILEAEEERLKKGQKPKYKIHCRGCFVKEPPPNELETFQPYEREWPYKLDELGNPISRFPSLFPLDNYLVMKDEDEYTFACQQLNNPQAAGEDSQAFNWKSVKWITPKELQNVNFAHFVLSVDTAEKQTKRADYTAMVVCGWDGSGRVYVVDAEQGKFLPEQTVEKMLQLYHKWGCVQLKIEESSFNRGLEPTIKRAIASDPSRNVNVDFIKRDSGESKTERILGIQPWFKAGNIRFSTALSDYIKEQFKKQFNRFPASDLNDLIDALADQFQNRTQFGRLRPRKSVEELQQAHFDKMIEGAFENQVVYGPQFSRNIHLGAL